MPAHVQKKRVRNCMALYLGVGLDEGQVIDAEVKVILPAQRTVLDPLAASGGIRAPRCIVKNKSDKARHNDAGAAQNRENLVRLATA
nr:hypothetical protein BaRGS_032212 [Batillaria attramentaria]